MVKHPLQVFEDVVLHEPVAETVLLTSSVRSEDLSAELAAIHLNDEQTRTQLEEERLFGQK